MPQGATARRAGLRRAFVLAAAAVGALGARAAAAAPAAPAVTPLQALIDAAVAAGLPSLSLAPGGVYAQGAAPLVVTASDFALLGNGARVVFAPGAGVVIERSTRVEVRGLTVAYDPPCFSQGAVVAVNASARPREFLFRLDAGWPSPPDAPAFASVETKLQFYDAATTRRVPQSGACIVTVVSGAVAPGVYALREAFGCDVPPDFAALRATVSSRVNGLDYQIPGGYVGGAWWVFNSTSVTTTNVTLLGSGNFAISEWGGGGGHVYDGVVLDRDADIGALLSSNTDGFHSFAVSSGPTLTRCRLAWMGDDVANVHNRVGVVLSAARVPPGPPAGAVGGGGDAYEVLIIDVGDTPTPRLNASEPARALAFARPGDVLKVTSAAGAPRGGVPGGALTLVSIAWDADPATVAAAVAAIAARGGEAADPRGVGVWRAVFAPPAGGLYDVQPDDITQFDRFAGAGARVVGNAFSDAYDSCFRLQASGALVANNSWARTSGGVTVTYDADWLEGAADIADVAVTGCTFQAVGFPPATRVADIFHVAAGVVNFTQTDNALLPPS